MAQSPLKDTAQPVDSEEEGRSSTMDRRWLIEKKNAEFSSYGSISNYTAPAEAQSSDTYLLNKSIYGLGMK